MRVLFVHHGENWIRGSERAMIDLADGVRRHGIEPVVACNAEAVHAAVEDLGITSMLISEPHRSSPLPGRREIGEWRALIGKVAPDLVHANSTHSLPPLLACGMLSKIPVVLHQHILDDQFSRVYSLMHQATAIVTISEEATLAVAADGYPAERLHRIPNGVTLRTDDETVDVHDLIGVPSNEFIAMSVGSLIHRKGHDRVIKGFASALARQADMHLVIVGSGTDEDLLRQLATSLGISGNVHFLGERHDVQALLRSASCYVTGAREEVQPLSVIEAMLSTLPIVASSIPAHVEMIDEEAGGLLVEADNAEEFADALVRVAGDSAWVSTTRSYLARVAPEQFSFDSFVSRFAELYSKLAAAPKQEYGFPRALRGIPAYAHWMRRATRTRVLRLAGSMGLRPKELGMT